MTFQGAVMAGEINYLGYAKSGHEFEVQDELRDMGIHAWVGRVIEWKRTGKKRYPEPHEIPALPNYVFMALTPHDFHRAVTVRFLASTLVGLGKLDRRGLTRFQSAVQAEYEAQDRLRRNAEVPRTVFNAGEQIEIIGGPFADKVATFRRVVERSGQFHPKLEAEMQGIKLQLDPLDVRRLG